MEDMGVVYHIKPECLLEDFTFIYQAWVEDVSEYSQRLYVPAPTHEIGSGVNGDGQVDRYPLEEDEELVFTLSLITCVSCREYMSLLRVPG